MTHNNMRPSSVMVLSSAGNSARISDGSFTDSEDIFMTIDSDSGGEFFAVEHPRAQEERQISVDPISLQGSTNTIRQASFRLVSPPKGLSGQSFQAPLPPPKLKFVSSSLPSSASSSPMVLKNHSGDQGSRNFTRMQSAMDDTELAKRDSETRRSRSVGGARASNPVDDFDEMWLEKSSNSSRGGKFNPQRTHSSKLPPRGPVGDQDQMKMKMKIKTKSRSRGPDSFVTEEDKFKCGKLCLFIPTRGKGKTIRSTSTASSTQMSATTATTEGQVISRTVSLERFECGSWSSNGGKENEGGESANLFFDLPMELLRCSVSDMQSPVSAAFVFDNDDHDNTTGVPPRLHQSKEEFDVFLEAQNT